MSSALAEWDRRIAAQADRARAAATDAYQRHVELGVALRARGRTTDALRELDAAAALRPSSDLQVLRALTLEHAGREDEARRAFRAAWSLDSSDAIKAYYLLTRADGAADAQVDRARAQLKAAYDRERTVNARPSIAPFAVLDAIPDTLSRVPVVGDELTGEAFALLSAGQYDEALAALRHPSSRRPPGERTDSPAAHFARAKEDEARNQVADARREYTAALRGTLAGRSVILVAIARLAQVEGDPAAAIDSFRHAVRLNPNEVTIHWELADALAADGRADERFCELVAGLMIDPLDARVFASAGQSFLDAAQHADAIAAFTRALELNPAAFEVRYALATALTRAGNAAEAARQFDRYERERRDALERRRRAIASEVEREEQGRGR